jgi:hypothetical protein
VNVRLHVEGVVGPGEDVVVTVEADDARQAIGLAEKQAIEAMKDAGKLVFATSVHGLVMHAAEDVVEPVGMGVIEGSVVPEGGA